MVRKHPLNFEFLLAAVAILMTLALFVYQVVEAKGSAARRVGMSIVQQTDHVQVEGVEVDGPAYKGGLLSGDRLLEIDGQPLRNLDGYDIPAANFERGKVVEYKVGRGGETLLLQVIPGGPVPWWKLLFFGAALVVLIGLAIATLYRGEKDLRAKLLVVFLFLLAFDLVVPIDVVGERTWSICFWAFYLLVLGCEVAVELHLAAVIPNRPPWLKRYPWVIPVAYIWGIGIGILGAATYVAEGVWEKNWFPWSYVQSDEFLAAFALPISSFAVLALLGRTAWRCPDLKGRLQAGLVLIGAFPRSMLTLITGALQIAGQEVPYWLDSVDYFALLIYPVAIFLAIYRYHLFDVEWVVRRGLLYTALSTILLLVFYGALALGGLFLPQVVDIQEYSVWLVSGAALILGLLFNSVRRWLRKSIEQRLFPERRALRERLIELARELPSLGKVPRMGEHLVTRLRSIFALRSATLLLTDPASGLLLSVASSPRDLEKNMSLSTLLTPNDPGMELLLQAGRPMPAERLVASSPNLRPRFAVLRADLVVPLANHDRLIGVLVLSKPETGRPLPAEEIDLLNLLAHQLASAFENVRLFESATYEGLTGLRRREAILELLGLEVERARRYARPLAIGFADLDHFKKVNDDHGHLAGDALLKKVAEELSLGLRGSDSIGRYGGEEFLLVFPETTLAGAEGVAEKLRVRIEKLRVSLDSGESLNVRISIGLAGLDRSTLAESESATVGELIAAADEALYRAKANGRNRVESARE